MDSELEYTVEHLPGACITVGYMGYFIFMKRVFKTDHFRRSRGGYSRLIRIRCEKCQKTICDYQKDGPGNLRRMYVDRISEAKVSMVSKQLTCPSGHVLGIRIIYEKERRAAFRLFVDAVTKRIVKVRP